MEDDLFDKLPEPCDEEEDMLDLAYGLKETSRLGCQVNIRSLAIFGKKSNLLGIRNQGI